MASQFPFGVELVTEGELPPRTVVFMHNETSSNVSGYGIVLPQNASVTPDTWGLCNLYDAPSYGFPSYDAKSTNITNPVYGVYRYRRIK